MPADRVTLWNPGVEGGIPRRDRSCGTIAASSFGDGEQDATKGIQGALERCFPGQVLELSAGTFRIDEEPLLIRKSVTLRGAGAGRTILARFNGSRPRTYVPVKAIPVVVIGPARWVRVNEATAIRLTKDGLKGSLSVEVSSADGFAAGQIVRLDEDDYTTAQWMPLPNRRGAPTRSRIWGTDRVVWQRHDPPDPIDDPFPAALTWFSRKGRPLAELKQVASVRAGVVTFTTPLHTGYRASRAAQLSRFDEPHLHGAGIEALTVRGGGDGNVRFESAAECWMKDVEDTGWLGEGVAIDASFRVEVRGSFVHDGVWPEPGGGGYGISLATGSSEVLIEDNIVLQVNKVMVARSAGAGSVVGYNYMDDGHIITAPGWQEVGLNASHSAGSHHVLFEGNESFNYDADITHGNAIEQTVFRNHLSGFRRDYPEDARSGNARAAGLEYGAWWHSFIGNVLGTPDRMTDWALEDPGTAPGRTPWQAGSFIWKLGYDPEHWEQAADAKVKETTLRHGNYDYVSGKVQWARGLPRGPLPPSLYLSARPPFFDAAKGYVWPWVDPAGATRLYKLPAKERYDAGKPIAQ